MKIAAGVIGLVIGFISLIYIGLLGGMVGSALAWGASFGPPGNADTGWAEMVKLLSWLAPLVVLAGGGATFANAKLGTGLLGLGAFLHWYLLGFGGLGNVFIFPTLLAAGLAFTAANAEGNAVKPSVGSGA